MDFSKPENARKINRLKVLSALREKPCSRAELSRKLKINKVSISEIADSLIKENLIREIDKDMSTAGRPSTILSIYRERGRVFSIEIKERKITVSASNLDGQVLRFMQLPRSQDFWKDVRNTIDKLSSSDVRNYGAAIIADDDLAVPDGLFDFPTLLIPSVIAEAKAEISHAPDVLSSTLFLSWSDTISAAYTCKELILLPSFSHMRVRNDGRCRCGGIGCLEESAALASIKEKSGLDVRSIMNMTLNEPLAAIAFAITEAAQILGVNNAMITGELSQMKDENYAYLQERISSKLPPNRREFVLFKSQCGESAAREGGGIAALECFFYQTELLEKLSSIENNSLCL